MIATIAVLLFALFPRATVHGTVRTEGSLLPVAGAVVEVRALGRTTATDARGYFTLADVPEGRWLVRASALGYAPAERTIELSAGGSVAIEFTLAPRPVALEGVEVRAEERSTLSTDAGPPSFRLDPTVVERIPAMVEADVLRALQTLPSVQAVSDFSSALYVRGGLPDQNLLMLDGAPLFNPYHLGGFFSAFDPGSIGSVELLPGAFPAAIGDRLSSAIDVRTREGGRDRVRGNGGVGLISSRVGVDGPLPGGRGSYLLSARRTYLDLFTDAAKAVGLISISLPYTFTDAHLKLTHEVGALGQLSVSAYVDEEDFSYQGIEDESGQGLEEEGQAALGWGSRMLAVGYWQPLGPSLVADLRAGLSDFHGDFRGLVSPFDPALQRYRADSMVVFFAGRTVQRDWFAAGDFAWSGARDVRRFGLRLDRYVLDASLSHDEDDLDDFLPVFSRADRPWTLAAYAEEEWSPSDALSLRGGVRLLHAGESGTEILPRLGARLALSSRLSLSLGAGRSAQVMRSLRSEESPFASIMAYDILAAVPAEAGLSTAEDVVLGVEWAKGGTRVRVDGYGKWLHGLAVPPLPDNLLAARILDPDRFQLAEGLARGLEILAMHSRGRASYSLAYALSGVSLTLGGERYTPRFERRHSLDASAALPWGRTGIFSTRLTWGSGQPYTPIVGITEGYEYDPALRRFITYGSEATLILGEHNAARLPAYFRVDVAARRDFTRRWFGHQVELSPYLSVINALNTPNVLFAVPEGFGSPRLEYPPQLPIFPTLGVEWSF